MLKEIQEAKRYVDRTQGGRYARLMKDVQDRLKDIPAGSSGNASRPATDQEYESMILMASEYLKMAVQKGYAALDSDSKNARNAERLLDIVEEAQVFLEVIEEDIHRRYPNRTFPNGPTYKELQNAWNI